MHQRDYILRMIEEIGVFFIALRKKILRGDEASAIEGDLSTAASQVGFDLDLLRGFTLDSLVLFVTPGGDVELAKCWLMAEVLYLDGLQASLEERGEDAIQSLTKARALYELVKPAGGMLLGMPEALSRIEEIDDLLGPLGGAIDGRPRYRSTRPRHHRSDTAPEAA